MRLAETNEKINCYNTLEIVYNLMTAIIMIERSTMIFQFICMDGKINNMKKKLLNSVIFHL